MRRTKNGLFAKRTVLKNRKSTWIFYDIDFYPRMRGWKNLASESSFEREIGWKKNEISIYENIHSRVVKFLFATFVELEAGP